MEKYNISRSGYLPKCHQMLRLPRKVTIQLHQILRLPRKMNLMIDARLIWNVISNAQSKQCQPPTSANTAPATKSLSSRFQRKLRELLPPIERRFDDIPTIIRPWNRHLAPAASETLLVPSWRRFCMEKYNISRSGYLPKCHQMLRLPRKVTLQLQQILRLPRKMNLLASIRSWHLFTLGIYSLLASILSWHLFSFGIYSLLASILSWHLFPLGIYSLLASIPSWHLFSLGIHSLLASILSWHLFARHLFSRHLFSWHLFSRHLFSWHLFSWHLFSWHLFSLAIYSLGIYSLLASIL